MFVAVGRLARHQNPFTSPDKTHLHHRFIKAGFTQRQALWVMWFIAVAFSWVSLRANTLQKIEAFGVLVFLLIILVAVLSYKARKRYSSK
jgi:UDP-GlcNAc:undecaprenyl-phosphate GlcNAc-1-phosphate transferase